MSDDLSSFDHPIAGRPRPLERLRTRRRLRRRDRISAELATAHRAIGLLDEAALHLDLGWAAGLACATCTQHSRVHGGATGIGTCVVGALACAAAGDIAATGHVIDLVWHELHRGTPRRTAHWHSPAGRRALQVADLRTWNDGPARTSDEVAALVRATRRTAQSAFDRARAQARDLVTV